jgi:hypothetical protein
MKRLAWLLLLPLASGVLFAQTAYTITPATLPDGTVGVLYSASLATSPQYTAAWSISAGSLPLGLTWSATGGTSLPVGSGTAMNITGTPIAVGNYSFTIQAIVNTGNALYTVLKTYAVAIAVSPVYISPSTLPNGTFGAAYSQVLTASGGYGSGTYTFSLDPGSPGSQPPGLVIAPAGPTTGSISGTPVLAGTFPFTVRVTSQTASGAAVYGTQAYSITISAAPLAITTASLPGGTVGALYSQALAATGGTSPYTWQSTGGSLPGGVTLDSAGNLYGTPTAAGSFTFQVRVSDSQQGSATGSFTIRIVPAALVVTTTSLPAGTVGTSYTATTLAATGGTPPYTWSVASGALSGGLSSSSAGVISGTPTASGTFSVTLKVTDSAQATATQAYSVTVAAAAAPLSITTQAPLPGGEVGVAYTQAFAATGGTQPYQWSVSAGAAPAGLTLNAATGSLTGTPTAAGTFNFTLQVADSARATATQAFAITVAAALTIPTATLPNGTVGTPYSQTLAPAGGTAPFTWSVSTGALPTGLVLSAAGSLTGTPTAAGTFTFTIQVADAAMATATQSFTITVTAALTITTASPLPGATVGIAYNQALALAGGAAPFTWSIASGALPAGIALNPGSLNGIPSAPGTFTFTVSVTGGGQSATKSFTITVGVPPGPSATITGLPPTATPATQPALGIGIPSAYPLAISGQVTLTFAPDSPSPDGQEVVFTTGGRTVSFTVPANTTQAVFSGATPGVQTGTVSGTITLTLRLTAAGIDITPSPAPSTTLLIAKSAPKITSATVTRTSGGFNLVVVGYATSREMVSAAITFTAATGVTLSSSQATISLAAVFTTWYQSSASTPYGSNFSLTMPFTFTNATSTAPLTSVSVVLTNAQGNSTSTSATY